MSKPMATDVRLGYKLGWRFCLLNEAEFISALLLTCIGKSKSKSSCSKERAASDTFVPSLSTCCSLLPQFKQALETLVCKFCTFQCES